MLFKHGTCIGILLMAFCASTVASHGVIFQEIPVGVLSHSDGTANVHWGEAWFRDTFTLPNGGVNNLTTATEDPWAIFRAVNEVFMSNGNYADGTSNGSVTALASPEAANYHQPWLGDLDHENIYQHVDVGSLVWPTLDYEDWKNLALEHGQVFSTNSSGELFLGLEKTPETRLTASGFYALIDQMDVLSVNVSVEGDQKLPWPRIIFIDTIDGNPPLSNGSNHCDIALSGAGGIFTRGVIYVGGSFRIGGAGSPPAIWMANPDEVSTGNGEWELENVRHMGVIYTAGIYEQQGNHITYGSIIAKGGFGSGGTPNVWYDARLRNGIDLNTPLLEVSPGSINFGEWPVNTLHNPTQTVTVINHGHAPLSFLGDRVVLSDPGSSEFKVLVQNLNPIPPLSSREIFIRFNPVAQGLATATLTIYTDDPEQGTMNVLLSGSGGEALSLAGLQTVEVVGKLVGTNDLQVDVNQDGLEDAADVTTNVEWTP